MRDTDRRIVVVGCGIMGASLAYELSSRGARVTVIEREAPAAGATGASFAWLTNQSFFRNLDRVAEAVARDYFRIHLLGLSAWRRLSAELGDGLSVRWNGTVHWTNGGSGVEHLNQELSRRQAWGGRAHPIDADEIFRLTTARPTEVGSAFFAPDEAGVDPKVAVNALLARAAESGAAVSYPCAAEGLVTTGGRVTAIPTSTGEIECDDVIFASGISTPHLVGDAGISVPLSQTAGGLVHLSPVAPFLRPLVMAPGVHAVQRADGRTVVSRHFTGITTSTPEVDVDALLRDTRALFPPLAEARVEAVTSAQRVVPIDGLPVVGRSERYPNVHSITTNAAISIGPILAQWMVTEILDGVHVESLDPYRSTRFDAPVAMGR
jgi:glycine/D-amino acid oxidase-like deaminating enzyme